MRTPRFPVLLALLTLAGCLPKPIEVPGVVEDAALPNCGPISPDPCSVPPSAEPKIDTQGWREISVDLTALCKKGTIEERNVHLTVTVDNPDLLPDHCVLRALNQVWLEGPNEILPMDLQVLGATSIGIRGFRLSPRGNASREAADEAILYVEPSPVPAGNVSPAEGGVILEANVIDATKASSVDGQQARVGIRVAVKAGSQPIRISGNEVFGPGKANVPDDPGIQGGHGIQVVVKKGSSAVEGVAVTDNWVHHAHTGTSEAIALNGAIHNFDVSGNFVSSYSNIGIDVMGGESQGPGQIESGRISRNLVLDFESGNVGGKPENHAPGAGLYVDGGASICIEHNITAWSAQGIEVEVEAKPGGVPVPVEKVVVRENVVVHPKGAPPGEKAPVTRRYAYGIRLGKEKPCRSLVATDLCARDNHLVMVEGEREDRMALRREPDRLNNVGFTTNLVCPGPSDPSCPVGESWPSALRPLLALNAWTPVTPSTPDDEQTANILHQKAILCKVFMEQWEVEPPLFCN